MGSVSRFGFGFFFSPACAEGKQKSTEGELIRRKPKTFQFAVLTETTQNLEGSSCSEEGRDLFRALCKLFFPDSLTPSRKRARYKSDFVHRFSFQDGLGGALVTPATPSAGAPGIESVFGPRVAAANGVAVGSSLDTPLFSLSLLLSTV